MKNFLLLLPLLLISILTYSQNAVVKGFVYDDETGEPIIFTNVSLKGTKYGVVTDVNGYYSITKVPAGKYTLSVSFLGYKTFEDNIELKANQKLTAMIHLVKTAVNMKTVEISAEKQESQSEVKMSVVKITPKQIKQIPTVGGQADLAQYLQVLPGVVFTGDQGGQLYIRGGSPVQNKVLLDGMIVYNPFHSIGLFSVFETDIIRNADVYTGGFAAEFGGRISSIMDITTKDGNKKFQTGKFGLSPFGANLLLDGPIKKKKDDNSGSISYILSAKTSYLEQSSKLLYRYIDSAGLPFNYTDLYGKITFAGNNGSKFNLFGFNYRDRVNFGAATQMKWNNYGLGANFILVPQGSTALVEGNFSFSNYFINLNKDDKPSRYSGVNGFNFNLDATYFILDDEIKYGMEFLGFSTDFQYFTTTNKEVRQVENTTEAAGYFKYKLNFGKLILDPSVRLHYYVSLIEASFEPRIGIKYNLTDNIRLKAAAGKYSQNLISATSDRDVVNLFYGYLSGTPNLQDEIIDKNGNVKEVNTSLQKANHFILGSEFDLTDHININIEGYLKQFTQLTNLNRNKIFEDENNGRPDVLKKDFIVETGDAYGVDFVFKYDNRQYYLWAVYSISKIDRWDGFREYNPIFDRRHNVNLVGSYKFGKDLNWEFNSRWNLGSGFPFTPAAGYYEGFTFQDGLETDYTKSNGDLQVYYGPLNSKRLPYYHRLDINLKYTYGISNNSDLEANVGITNAYNRANLFYIDRLTAERVRQLPFMPSAGVTLTF